jgi:hypothetical protein
LGRLLRLLFRRLLLKVHDLLENNDLHVKITDHEPNLFLDSLVQLVRYRLLLINH